MADASFVWRCMIVTDADRTLARSAWATLDPEYNDEFRIPLAAASDPATVTHWLSAGPVTTGAATLMPLATWARDEDGAWQRTAYVPGYPAIVAERCRAADPPLDVTDAAVEALWEASDVTEQQIPDALDRLGLVMHQPPEDVEEEA